MKTLRASLAVLVLCVLRTSLGYDGDTCCRRALRDGAFIKPPPLKEQICGQKYGPYKSAQPLYVDFKYCWEKCPGIGRSKTRDPSQWAAPIVQFILPSVIFSMGIPRRKKFAFDYLFDWTIDWFPWSLLNRVTQLGVSLLLFVVIIIPVVIDTSIWILVMVTTAGDMIVAALYEAHVDYRIVEYVLLRQRSPPQVEVLSMRDQKELLVTVVTGNLRPPSSEFEETPQMAVLDSLDKTDSEAGQETDSEAGQEKAKSRLLNLLEAQSSFGSAVGSPVLFYLGAFVYTILDLLSDPSSQDAALSLGYGIEWMIIVHVAICSGCALASNNPSTLAGIVGAEHEALQLPPPPPPPPPPRTWPDQLLRAWLWFQSRVLGWRNVYDTVFQPVTIWSRGTNKMDCLRRTNAWNAGDFRRRMEMTAWGWVLKVLAPALALVSLPPATGAVVTYFTPPRGVACRSLSFIIYAACQAAVAALAVWRHAGWAPGPRRLRRAASLLARALLRLLWLCSFLAAAGSTAMQIAGVYRNCVCYAPASAWRALAAADPLIDLASDTADARASSRYWAWMGGTAAVFMAANCYIGWWYQRLVRTRFTRAVVAMREPRGGAAGAGGDDADSPQGRYDPPGRWRWSRPLMTRWNPTTPPALLPLRGRAAFPAP